jgi:hypothetical protein
MTRTTAPVTAVSAKGDLVSLDGQFYTVTAIQSSLDGDLVVAVSSSAAALAATGIATITCKVADLHPRGTVAGMNIWGR